MPIIYGAKCQYVIPHLLDRKAETKNVICKLCDDLKDFESQKRRNRNRSRSTVGDKYIMKITFVVYWDSNPYTFLMISRQRFPTSKRRLL